MNKHKKQWIAPALKAFNLHARAHMLTVSDDYNPDGSYNNKNRSVDRFQDEGDI